MGRDCTSGEDARAGRIVIGRSSWFGIRGEAALFVLVWFWLTVSRLPQDPAPLADRLADVTANLGYWLLWVAVGAPYTALVHRYPIERPHRLRRALRYELAGVLTGAAHGLLHTAASAALFGLPAAFGPAVAAGATYGQLVFWSLIALKHGSYYYAAGRDAERRAAQLEGHLARARVEAVRLEIKPESIRARLDEIVRWLRRDPQAADDRIVRLGAVLRRRLERVGGEWNAPLVPGPDDFLRSPRRTLGRWGIDWRGELFVFLAWNLAMLGPVLLSRIVRENPSPEQIVHLARELLLHASLWVVVCLPLSVLVQRLPVEAPHRVGRLLGYSVLALVTGLVHALSHVGLARLFFDPATTFYASSLGFALRRDLSVGQANFGIFLFVKHLIYFRRRYRDRLSREAELAAQLSQAQLDVLQRQLHPHFLFNTLHSISELAHEDAAAAEEMTRRLADLLDLAFARTEDPFVPLGQELAFLDRYAGLQRVRFADRLSFAIEAPAATLDWPVPRLILQPLVENAIKHGVARRRAGGTVRVRCRETKDGLEIRVDDEGAPVEGGAPPSSRLGVGLANVERRLPRLYGGRYGFRLEADEGRFTARLTIPRPVPVAGTTPPPAAPPPAAAVPDAPPAPGR